LAARLLHDSTLKRIQAFGLIYYLHSNPISKISSCFFRKIKENNIAFGTGFNPNPECNRKMPNTMIKNRPKTERK